MFEQRRPLRAASMEADDSTAAGDVGAVLARWTVQDPCPVAVAELAAIDPRALSDADRVRLVVALDRQAARVASL